RTRATLTALPEAYSCTSAARLTSSSFRRSKTSVRCTAGVVPTHRIIVGSLLLHDAQHLDDARAETAAFEELSRDLVGGGGVEPDLCDADLAEAFDGGHRQLFAQAFVAVVLLDPEVV